MYKIIYLLAVPRTAFVLSCFHSKMLSFMYLSLASVGNRGMCMLPCMVLCCDRVDFYLFCAGAVKWWGSVLTYTPCHQDVGGSGCIAPPSLGLGTG